MRQGQNSKRSRGRGSGRRSNVPTRHQTFDSNGPSVRIRGNAYQVYEKYLALARDATASGDRITAENFMQHAEHYFRIINADGDGENRARAAAQRVDGARGDTDSGDSDDSEAVVEAVGQSAGNGADTSEAAGEGEQPVVEFPNGEAGQADGEAAPAPKRRGHRVPRVRRARPVRRVHAAGVPRRKPMGRELSPTINLSADYRIFCEGSAFTALPFTILRGGNLPRFGK